MGNDSAQGHVQGIADRHDGLFIQKDGEYLPIKGTGTNENKTFEMDVSH